MIRRRSLASTCNGVPLRRWFLLSAALMTMAAVTAHATPSAELVVREVQKRYEATNDFTADVRQEMTIASLERTLTARGTVSYKKPGRLRWQLEGADGQVIVADGSNLWLYQPEERQVLKAPFESAFRASAPISFLLGVGHIVDDFEFSIEPGGGEPAGGTPEPLTWLKLIPRQGDGALGWLRLGVTRHTFDIGIAEIHDQVGNVTRLQFSNMKRNVGLDDGLFRFQVPDGIDVVEAPIGF